MTPHFSNDELKCRCGCGEADMNPAFMSRLERVRIAYGKPMALSSAYRCQQHNFEVGGSKLSPHMEGRAVDVLVRGGDALELLDAAIYCGMTGFGIKQKGKGRFIHIDDADALPERPRKWIWSY